MSDLDPIQVLADLTAQGLDTSIDVGAVRASVDLWRQQGIDPATWSYDPDGDPAESIYAPTAAEMHPDLVPEDGWPPPIEEPGDVSTPGSSLEPGL